MSIAGSGGNRLAPGRLARLFHRSEAARQYALLSPSIALLAFALTAPLGLLVLYSFWTQNGLELDRDFTLAQYGDALGRPFYRDLFLRSVGISALVTLVTVALAYPMAYFVAFKVTKHKFVWLVLLSIPFWTSYLLRVFAWKVYTPDNASAPGLFESGFARFTCNR